MSDPHAERYLRLGLQVGRHVDGIVDAYFGPPELAAEVEAEPPADPRLLVAEAEALLDEVEDSWLRDQLGGLRTYTGVLAGESRSYSDEVEGCFGVRPSWADERVFAEAHEQLERLLPGDGPLAERYERWQQSSNVPADQAEELIAAVIEEARGWTRRHLGLPDGEGVELEIVHDKAWWAFCGYLGDFRSHIEVNVDLPLPAIDLIILASHETYPGHHTERACKEARLVREQGLLEETLVLVPTPQSVIAEGIATLAPQLLFESESGPQLAQVIQDYGVEFDLTHAVDVVRALKPCRAAEVNAALMLHEQGASEAETQAYLERWGLVNPKLAANVVRFFAAPTSRTYILTYYAGEQLCGAYVAGDLDRFRRLLTEQVRIGELLDASATQA